MNATYSRVAAFTVALVLGATVLASTGSNAAAIITINDLAEGVLAPPTIADQPPDVPGIQNVAVAPSCFPSRFNRPRRCTSDAQGAISLQSRMPETLIPASMT